MEHGRLSSNCWVSTIQVRQESDSMQEEDMLTQTLDLDVNQSPEALTAAPSLLRV